MRRLPLALALLASGCGAVGLENSSSGVDAARIHIDAIDPDDGPVGHETPVVISGSGFTGGVQVWFGGTSAPTTVVDTENLLVVAPATDVAGAVDVRISSEAGEATVSGGFTYTSAADAGGDTGDNGGSNGGNGGTNGGNGGNGGSNGGGNGGSNGGDSGGSNGGDTGDTADTSGAGLIGGLLELSLVQIACPDCLGYTSNLQVSADGAFHAPTEAGWFDWLFCIGTCAIDPSPSAPASRFLDAGSRASLESRSTTITLQATAGLFAASGLDETDYERSADYDFRLSSGGADLDAFTISPALTTPAAISELTPADMLYTQPASAFAAHVRASDATFTWGPSGGTDAFLLLVDVYSPSGVFLHEIACLDDDTGTMTIPSSEFSGDPQNSLLVIGMYRYQMGGYTRPDNASTVQTVATFGVIGTGVLIP